MPLTEYHFTLASEGWFPNFKVDPAKFTQEINASADITTTLHSVFERSGDCVVVFADALSAPEVEALETLVQVHDGVPFQPPLDDSGRPIVSMPNSSFGLPIVAVRDAPDDAADYMKSWQITVPPSTTSLLDIIIADKLVGPQGLCYLIGGHYRVRTDAAEGSALHLAIVDRDDLLGLFGLYGLQRTRLTGLTDIVGTFSVGDYVWGDTSGRHARILAVGSDWLAVTWHDGPFTDGESLTGKNASGVPTGATATLGVWDEGDVIEIKRYVEDEWIEGYDQREVKAGGSKQLPTGLYLRIISHNAHLTENLRVKLGFQFATK
jgi:hypothetical protein